MMSPEIDVEIENKKKASTHQAEDERLMLILW
jgi:hypothetical protein